MLKKRVATEFTDLEQYLNKALGGFLTVFHYFADQNVARALIIPNRKIFVFEEFLTRSWKILGKIKITRINTK